MDLEGLQRDLTVVTEVTAGLARNAVDTLMTMQKFQPLGRCKKPERKKKWQRRIEIQLPLLGKPSTFPLGSSVLLPPKWEWTALLCI